MSGENSGRLSENVERGRRAYAALNRRDLDAFLEFMDPEVEINTRLATMEGRSYHGLDGTRDWWRDMLAVFPDFSVELLEVHDYEAFLIVHVQARGHGADSGAPFGMKFWQAVEMRRDKVAWWQMFSSEREALEAARKRE